MAKPLPYTQRARQLGITGFVVVQFAVTLAGTPEDFAITKSVEYSLDEASLEFIRQSQPWMAGTLDGIQIRAATELPVVFSEPGAGKHKKENGKRLNKQ